jgi:hypothetical protein
VLGPGWWSPARRRFHPLGEAAFADGERVEETLTWDEETV